MSDNKQLQNKTFSLAWIPAVAGGLSIVYLYWFSIGSGISILSLMTPSDFISATLPFFIPTAIIFIFGGTIAVSHALNVPLVSNDHPETKGLKHKWRKVPFSIKYAILATTFVTVLIFFEGINSNSLLILILVAYNLFCQFFQNIERFDITLKVIKHYGNIGFIIPAIIPAFLLISFNGYGHGRSGNIPMSSNKPLAIELCTGEVISGTISFCAGNFTLIYSETNNVPFPILLQTDDISRMSKSNKKSNQRVDPTVKTPVKSGNVQGTDTAHL